MMYARMAAALLLATAGSALAVESTPELSASVQVLDDITAQPIAGAQVIVDGKSYPVDASGSARIPLPPPGAQGGDGLSISAAYLDGKIRRLETVHGVTAQPEITLRVPNQQGIRREAVFSVGVPFGPIQRQAKAMLLLPQPAYESGGLNFGHYDQVRLYQDQLQTDGRFSLMVVALDDALIPWKFGYMLDVAPESLDDAHLMFMPPRATGIEHERQLLRWQKQADPIGGSDASSACDFKAPPFTECGLYPDKGGIFSWINIWRKGQLFHAPGAFLPARTVGANPLLALPEGQIELVGHDDPKGFAPFNYARHRFLRFDAPPAEVIDIVMPNVLIGAIDKPGAEAIALDSSARGATFVIQSAGDSHADADNLDLGKLQMIWTSGRDGVRTVWNQYFGPRQGSNTVSMVNPPESLSDWLPDAQVREFENVQVWLYGSEGVSGYTQALALRMKGENPLRQGTSAFQVTRWR